MNKVVHSSNKMDWETPDAFFQLVNREFHFDLDVCAVAETAKVPNFISPEMDAFKCEWNGRRCWMNPPYGTQIGKWMHLAASKVTLDRLVVALVPVRPDTDWWHQAVLKPRAEVRVIRGRIHFVGAEWQAPFPSALVIYRYQWWMKPLTETLQKPIVSK